MSTIAIASTPTTRFASVDALRGITVAAMLLVNNPGDWAHVYPPLLHAQWHGCTPTDLIFPFFLFIVGVSIALGLVPRVECGATGLHRGAVVRALWIVGLGLMLHWLAWWWLDRAYFRPWGVLQRIGLCFAAAALCAIHLRARMQWLCIAALLVGYSGVLAWGGSLAPLENLASRIDTALLGPWLYEYDAATGRGHDPEGLPSTLPAIATTLLGLRAGAWLRQGALRRLAAVGVSLLLLGAVWAHWQPFNKNLWTASYVLWTGGWAMLALAATHRMIDVQGWPALGLRFGRHALAAYAGSALMVYALSALGLWEPIYRIGFADWMTPLAGPRLPSLAFALCFVWLWWLIVRAMDARGWRLRL